MILNPGPLDWESSAITTRPISYWFLKLDVYSPKSCSVVNFISLHWHNKWGRLIGAIRWGLVTTLKTIIHMDTTLRSTIHKIRWFSKATKQERDWGKVLASNEHKTFCLDDCLIGLTCCILANRKYTSTDTNYF